MPAPRALFTADGFWRRGQRRERQTADADRRLARSRACHGGPAAPAGDDAAHGRDQWWHEAMDDPVDERRRTAEPTDAEDPLMIIYTSGTTGRPKGAVHTHCGFPIKAAQDMAHAFDVHAGDTMYWVTDIGWMMGPWEAVRHDAARRRPWCSTTARSTTRARIACGRWSARHRVNILGVSPTLIRALMRHGDEPVARTTCRRCASSARRASPGTPSRGAGSSTSPAAAALPIINYSGGTEVSGGIV